MSVPQTTNFTMIPAVVRYANIADFAKILYSEILSRSKQTGHCYTSNARLSEIFNITDKQNSKVKRAMAQLQKEKFIQTQGKSFKRRVYPLFDEKSEAINTDVTAIPAIAGVAGITTMATVKEKTAKKHKKTAIRRQQPPTIPAITISDNLKQVGESKLQPVINGNDHQPPVNAYFLTDTYMSSTNNWCNYTLATTATTTHTMQKYTNEPCKSAPHNKKGNKEKVKSKLSFSLTQFKNAPVEEDSNTSNVCNSHNLFHQWKNVTDCFSYESDTFKMTVIEYVRLLQKDRKVNPAYLKKANEFIIQYANNEKEAIQIVRQAISNFVQQKGSIRPLNWQPATTNSNEALQTPFDLVQHINSFSEFWQFEKWLNNMAFREPKQIACLYHTMSIDQKKNIKNGWFYDLQRVVNKVRR